MAPAAWAASHSLSSRTSTSCPGSPSARKRLYSSISISRMRVLASCTRARKPGLWCLTGVLISTLLDAFDFSAGRRELLFDLFVTAIDVIDPVDGGFALRNQSS